MHNLNRKFPVLLIFFLLFSMTSFSQISARIMRFPDVSKSQIAFVYAGDIWIVNKDGGTAQRLSSPKGTELFPRFSPDGTKIAFSANYQGNEDVFVMSVTGGVPERLTYHTYGDRLLDWAPSGEKILFSSSRESGKQRFSQFFLIDQNGGMPEKLPVPYGEFGSLSPDGKKIVYTQRSRVFRTWKRYAGGMATNITLFELENNTAEDIITSNSNDELPMWHQNKIYFLSDRGASKRSNIWSYNLETKGVAQITDFADADVHFPSMGPEEIVFEANGTLYLLDLQTEKYKEVEINLITDQLAMQPQNIKTDDKIGNFNISPDGKRAVIEARGEIFSLPLEHGFVTNLTQKSSSAERFPAWSPDGKKIAYWSDASGEYQLTITDLTSNTTSTYSSFTDGFRYHIYWSPDSKKLAFIDQAMKINLFSFETKQTLTIDQGLWMYQGALNGFQVNWSPDSRWIAYSRGVDNRNNVLFLYDTKNNQKHQVTSGFYYDSSPAFDPEGKYLYFTTERSFNPLFSNFENSFIYPNTSQIAVVPLRKDVKSPLYPKNDEVEIKKEEETSKKEGKDKKDKNGEKKDGEKTAPVEIDLDGFESRAVILPIEPGNYGLLSTVKGKVIFLQSPNTGSEEKENSVKYYDLEERKVKEIIKGVNSYKLAHNGEKMIVGKGRSFAIIDAKENQKMGKMLKTSEMRMSLVPKEEWKQVFTDAWRIERDYFYDKNMHGLDWKAVKGQYEKLLDDAQSREDVNYVIGELIGEMNASHTYRGGGDEERAERLDIGYLGIDWGKKEGKYFIKHIVKGASWDIELKSPLDVSGVEVKEGDYILAVNGIPLESNKEPYHAFQGLAGKTVELTVNSQPIMEGSRKILVETISNEAPLRHLEWIESNRKAVDVASDGKIGYIYVQSTGVDGLNQLARQFYGQWHKDALIIDERFNNGGMIPDRFVEMLNRKPLAFWAVRDGKDWQWPQVANFGPKAMLINGWSGSGGDAFPDYFKKSGAGPLIGTRTWGGLIGITGTPSLIDGGYVTAPTFRMYDPDGKWFKEGYGVDPDIEVKEDPAQLAKGKDMQILKAVEVLMEELKTKPYVYPKHAPYEKR